MPRRGRDRRPVAERLLTVADRLAQGQRETPQRLFQLASRARETPEISQALIEHLLAEARREATEEGLAGLAALIGRVGEAVTAPASESIGALIAEINDLAPRQRRRRHIHCHGQITGDRRLLMLRNVLQLRSDQGNVAWYALWLVLAYWVSDYDHDHFVMIGPAVERRMRRLAAWVAAQPALSAAKPTA